MFCFYSPPPLCSSEYVTERWNTIFAHSHLLVYSIHTTYFSLSHTHTRTHSLTLTLLLNKLSCLKMKLNLRHSSEESWPCGYNFLRILWSKGGEMTKGGRWTFNLLEFWFVLPPSFVSPLLQNVGQFFIAIVAKIIINVVKYNSLY